MSLYVKYLDYPAGAAEACTVTCTGAQQFSQPVQQLLAGYGNTAWATLEEGGWPLDGSRALIKDTPAGLWSAAPGGRDGLLPVPLTVTLAFSAPYTATGLTFSFGPAAGQYCRQLHVRWYNGQRLLAEQAASPDRADYVLARTVESFDRIVLSLQAAAPGQFVKLARLQVGQVITLGPDELVQARLLNEVDPSLCEVAVDTMTIRIRDRHGRSYAPQERQMMQLWRGDTQLAAQYIVSSTRQAAHFYSFDCQSVIGLLEDDYLGGLYQDMPLDALLAGILGGYAYSIAPAFSGAAVTGYLPVCPRREALQQVCIAAGAMVTTQGSGIVQLAPIPEAVDAASIPGSRIFPGGALETAARVSRVQVYAHSYTPCNERETLLNGEEIAGENLLYTFGAPHHDYQITGGTITASGDNWVRLTAHGPVTLTAAGYTHSQRAYVRSNPAATAAERNNTVTVDAATLVHAGNAEAVLNRLYSHLLLRQTLTEQIVAGGQQAGQMVVSQNPWGGKTLGFLTSMDTDLTQSGAVSSATIIGKNVELRGAVYYSGQLYAGEEAIY